MLKLVIVGTVFVAAQAMQHPINSEIVKIIKETQTRWTPYEPSENPLRHWTSQEIKARLGTIVGGPIEGMPAPEVANGDLPKTFDSREKWSKCIHPIRDQAACGSCWAFAATEALSDRFCIASSGDVDVVLSPQDMVSCDAWDMGCNGGILPWAWSYLSKTGAVSESCFPYASQEGNAPKCEKSCADGEAWKKYKCDKTVQATTIDEIKSEILANGPMETGFTVYQDFMNYKGGVYVKSDSDTNKQLGGHAVKIVGWGEDYWICANSWSEDWGEKGFFNIQFGQCGIDSAVYACSPKL